MNYYRYLGVIGSILILASLTGVPWYLIIIPITRETSDIFSYSPFLRIVDIQGTMKDYHWLYGADTAFFGVLVFVCALIPLLKEREPKWRLISPLIIFFIMIFFASMLPMSITSATRLYLGIGLLFSGIGALIVGLSYFMNKT